MAKYRSLEPVTFVADGKVWSVDAGRIIDLDDKQAEALAGKVVVEDDDRTSSMFPDGAPIVSAIITRDVPLPSFTPAPESAPAAPVVAPKSAPASAPASDAKKSASK